MHRISSGPDLQLRNGYENHPRALRSSAKTDRYCRQGWPHPVFIPAYEQDLIARPAMPGGHLRVDEVWISTPLHHEEETGSCEKTHDDVREVEGGRLSLLHGICIYHHRCEGRQVNR